MGLNKDWWLELAGHPKLLPESHFVSGILHRKKAV